MLRGRIISTLQGNDWDKVVLSTWGGVGRFCYYCQLCPHGLDIVNLTIKDYDLVLSLVGLKHRLSLSFINQTIEVRGELFRPHKDIIICSSVLANNAIVKLIRVVEHE